MDSQSGNEAMQASQGPPYAPPYWMLGGTTEVHVDVPISAVFLAMFVIGAASHMTIFQLNKKKGHKFLMSGLLFGFCMARIATLSMRIASVTHASNTSLAIAAQVFVSAGILLIYIINIIFAQRLMRAQHPNLGWHPLFSIFFKFIYVLVFLTLVIVITGSVQTFFTLDTNTRRIDRDLQLYGATIFLFVAFLPFLIVALGLSLPRKSHVDKFGAGRFRAKIAILLAGTFLASFGAAYRCGTSFMPPVPRTAGPLPSYYHKAAFYMVNFGVEIMIVYLYAILRVDLRFHIPNGAHGKGSYQQGAHALTDGKGKAGENANASDEFSAVDHPHVYTEEETFDDTPEGHPTDEKPRKEEA